MFFLNLLSPQKRHVFKAWHNILGFYPNDLDLFRTAATHVSCQKKDKNGNIISNERLEYLGDSIISFVVADVLYHTYPDATEGFLTRTRSKIVCRSHLNDVSQHTGFNIMLQTSRGLKSNAQNVYGNAIEALVGAIYLDRGFKKAQEWVVNNIARHGIIKQLDEVISEDTDFKSIIYEWAQTHHKPLTFETINHAYDAAIDQHTYTTRLLIDNQPFATGTGTNKRLSEQNAAQKAAHMLNIHKKE